MGNGTFYESDPCCLGGVFTCFAARRQQDRTSQLFLDLGDEIREIDINPLLVLEKGKGAVAVDCLMTRKR